MVGGLCRAAPGGCAGGHRPDLGLVVRLEPTYWTNRRDAIGGNRVQGREGIGIVTQLVTFSERS
jgi:hypothetical protein